ncbi:MAG: hypothetical protein WBM11_18555 [Terriglobales bacterium]
MNNDLATAVQKLLAYCQGNDWAGYEPYDVLNSKIVNSLPFLDFKLPRLVLTQTLKRSPINIRGLLLIPKTQNPKAIGLFLSALVRLSTTDTTNHEEQIDSMIERLVALRSQGERYWCWGYNFPWQTRTELVPRWAPNLVCTAFAADALLDAYEQRNNGRCLKMAVSAAEFILNELYWSEGERVGFGYPLPSMRNQVHNANLLAGALFCRVHKHTGDEKFLAPALKVARYSAAQQRADGGWAYGEARTQQWIDNFHTGFNLSSLRNIARYAKTTEFDLCLKRGFEFYRAHFFREDGAVRYFHNQTYPIDTHCVAQSIITLVDLQDLDSSNVALAHSVFGWAMDHMWDDRGFFYYRILRTCTIRTSYMRWTQAWMFLALCRLLCVSTSSASGVRPEASLASAGAQA